MPLRKNYGQTALHKWTTRDTEGQVGTSRDKGGQYWTERDKRGQAPNNK